MTSQTFADGYKDEPYWWQGSPRPQLAERALPDRADVLVVGSGYTGLCAALETARAGRHTVVVDAQDAGWGCSSRNGGLISTSIKPSFSELAARYGEQSAFAIRREGHNALEWIADFVATEQLDCSFRISGKFYGAHTAGKFEEIAADLGKEPKGLEVKAHVVPRSEQHKEIATDLYHGGIVYEQHASVNPARYHQSILARVLACEADIVTHCPVLTLQRDGSGFEAQTGKGKVKAQHVIVATNGYTGALLPWLQRRIIPIGSYMIATEALPRSLIDELLPGNRTIGDTRKVVYYYRPSPDRSRIIFGGRVTANETDPRNSAPLLYRDLVELFPALKDYGVSHSWMGYVAYTFDHLAHVGHTDGVYYAMGYCGSGVAMSSYLGTRIAQQLLGKPEGQTGFDNLRFPTRPFYFGNPWFLSTVVAYYRWRDRMAR